MDSVERLIEVFGQGSTAPVLRKLDALLDVEQSRDPRALPHLLHTVLNHKEPIEVRMRIVRLLRTVHCSSEIQARVGGTLAEVLVDRASADLRVAAALTLAEFTETSGVPAVLGQVVLDASEPLDLRYSAFTSLERVGPTPECVALLRRLALDDAFGRSAQSLLARWQVS